MNVIDLLQCAKPLIFENADEQYSYSIQGTCFLTRFQNGYFVVTAKHCLINRTAGSVRIRMNPGDLSFLPIRAVHSFQGDDKDFLDLAIFEIEPELVSNDILKDVSFADLDKYIKNPFTGDTGAILALLGYPSDINSIDYDTFIIHTRGFSPDGRYAGPAEDEHCSKIKFNELGGVNNLDGLSGSPVFQFKQVGELDYIETLAGVLIRATRQSKESRFINAGVLYQALKQMTLNK